MKKLRERIESIKELNSHYHLIELAGIVSSLIMAIASYVPVFQLYDMRQLTIVIFFLMMFGLKLWLFLWNRQVDGTSRMKHEQAKMMLVAAIILLLMHSTVLIAILYQLLVKEKTPLMASLKTLTIVYGVYTLVKIISSLRGMVAKKKMNKYQKTLSYLGWISAVYTLCLFTNYLLIAEKADNLTWARYIMISAMGLTTFVLGILMTVEAIQEIRVKADAQV